MVSTDRRSASTARRAGRHAIRTFGILSSPARSLPDFVVIGTKRGGTTSMYRYLLEHPQVLALFPSASRWPVRADIKGVHFFDNEFDAGTKWYRSHFPVRAYRRAIGRRRGEPVLAGEASPYYLYHPHAAERARSVIPRAKFIVLLRDPVARAYSHYTEQRRRRFESLPTFAEALAAEPARLDGELARMTADRSYRSFAHEHQSYLDQSRYASSLERWFAHFPLGQFLVLRSEDFFADPQRVYDQVVVFLGLPRHRLGDPRPFNSIGAQDFEEGLRHDLMDRLADDRTALTALLGRSFDWAATSSPRP